jgi:hypothetical protein
MFESRDLDVAEGVATDMAVHASGFCAALATTTGHILFFDVRDGSMRCTSFACRQQPRPCFWLCVLPLQEVPSDVLADASGCMIQGNLPAHHVL